MGREFHEDCQERWRALAAAGMVGDATRFVGHLIFSMSYDEMDFALTSAKCIFAESLSSRLMSESVRAAILSAMKVREFTFDDAFHYGASARSTCGDLLASLMRRRIYTMRAASSHFMSILRARRFRGETLPPRLDDDTRGDHFWMRNRRGTIFASR